MTFEFGSKILVILMGLSHFRFNTSFLWYFIDCCNRRERIGRVKLSILYLPKFFAT